MAKPKIADLIKYLRDIYEAGLRRIKYDVILQDIKIPDYLARFWLHQLEQNGYVEICWGVIILKDKLARSKNKPNDTEDSKKKDDLVMCPSCFNVMYEHEIKRGRCPECDSKFLTPKTAADLLKTSQ